MSSTRSIQTGAVPSAEAPRPLAVPPAVETTWKSLYTLGGVAALVAFATNVLDVVLGLGEMDTIVPGTRTAADWFALYQEQWFTGLYLLGILNIVYMAALVPVYFAICAAHRRASRAYAVLVMILSLIGMAIYISNNAAIPMLVLSEKYAAAGTDTERALFVAAGEAVLARGEDFTPGAFVGTILGAIAAAAMSFVMLRGAIFGKATAWIGMIGFTFLSVFTIWATFIPVLYDVAFYGFGMLGGLLVLAWFVLVALDLFKLGRSETGPV
jgi:hypothetical protein